MYRKKNREIQVGEVKISLKKLVPENHILRAIDFSFIYEEVEGLYSDKGRPGIDPVSLFKIVLPVHRLLVDGTCAAFLQPYIFLPYLPLLLKIKRQSPPTVILRRVLSTSCAVK